MYTINVSALRHELLLRHDDFDDALGLQEALPRIRGEQLSFPAARQLSATLLSRGGELLEQRHSAGAADVGVHMLKTLDKEYYAALVVDPLLLSEVHNIIGERVLEGKRKRCVGEDAVLFCYTTSPQQAESLKGGVLEHFAIEPWRRAGAKSVRQFVLPRVVAEERARKWPTSVISKVDSLFASVQEAELTFGLWEPGSEEMFSSFSVAHEAAKALV